MVVEVVLVAGTAVVEMVVELVLVVVELLLEVLDVEVVELVVVLVLLGEVVVVVDVVLLLVVLTVELLVDVVLVVDELVLEVVVVLVVDVLLLVVLLVDVELVELVELLVLVVELLEVDVLEVDVVDVVVDVLELVLLEVVVVVVVATAQCPDPSQMPAPSLHDAPAPSKVQLDEQQSPELVLPSSHASQTSMVWLPHTPAQAGTRQLWVVMGDGLTDPVTTGGLVGSRYSRRFDWVASRLPATVIWPPALMSMRPNVAPCALIVRPAGSVTSHPWRRMEPPPPSP